MNTCGFSSNVQPQNNWLFSQHISYLDANEIFFNVTFDFTNCRDNAECSNDYVTLYYYDTNGPVNEELRTDHEMYTTLRRLQQRPDGQGGDTVHFPFTRPQSDTNGFYLGVQDDGTCGTVGRILVYYRVARGRTEDLLTCPDVALPIQGSNLNSQGTCSCGANASLASATLNRICNEDGICNENQVCACVPGYYLAGSDCTGMTQLIEA